MNLNEIWRCIPDYPNYEISNLGNVRNGRILNLGKTNNGYLKVQLWKNGEQKWFSVHRLVAEAFIPNPSNLPEVNHKDENKLNNNVDNLEWCSRQYNQEYSLAKQVLQYDLSGNLIKTWKSVHEIERCLGFLHGNISACCNGKFKTMYGYIWKYI